MKNKKGLSETTVVVLIIGLLTLVVLIGVGYTITQGISSAGNKAAIYNWVSLKSSKLGLVQGGSQPPVAMLYSEPIKINTEEQLKTEGNKLIADAMVDCWSAFDNGQTDFIKGKNGVKDPFCFPCAKIEFDKSLKDGTHNILEFDKFLTNEKSLGIGGGKTYDDMLEGKYIYDQTIQKDKDLYIFFIATKGNIWERLVKTVMDPSFADEINKDIISRGTTGLGIGVIFGPGAIPGAVIIGVGPGVVKAYAKRLFWSDEIFNPILYLKTANEIQKLCDIQITTCDSCGDGTWEKCDKDECQNKANEIGYSCYWDTEYINECLSTQKPDTEELKSANPIATQTTSDTTTTPINDIKITSEQCKASIGSSEMKALLDTIAWAEGADYNIMFGKRIFTDFSAHPAYTGQMPPNGFPYGKTTSTAAGRYQFLKDTYDSEKSLGLFSTGFTPDEQDKAAIDLITRKRKLTEEQLKKAVESNEFITIWDKLAPEWASLPYSKTDCNSEKYPNCGNGNSFYGQSKRTKEQLKSKYYECYQQYNKQPEPLLTAQKI